MDNLTKDSPVYCQNCFYLLHHTEAAELEKKVYKENSKRWKETILTYREVCDMQMHRETKDGGRKKRKDKEIETER